MPAHNGTYGRLNPADVVLGEVCVRAVRTTKSSESELRHHRPDGEYQKQKVEESSDPGYPLVFRQF